MRSASARGFRGRCRAPAQMNSPLAVLQYLIQPSWEAGVISFVSKSYQLENSHFTPQVFYGAFLRKSFAATSFPGPTSLKLRGHRVPCSKARAGNYGTATASEEQPPEFSCTRKMNILA